MKWPAKLASSYRCGVMRTRRIHITGASGAGVTTLALAIAHHDTDDYFWRQTTPPYTQPRDVPAGRMGGPVIALFDLVVFLYVPTELRMQRLHEREARRGWVDKEFIESALVGHVIGATR
jgi:uridine kinase